MPANASVDKKPQEKKIMLSTGRGGSGNIRRVKSTKEMISRPLASPKLLELEPPRNRAAYGGRGGSGNVWTHVLEEGVFDRVLGYEISRARVLKEERAHEKAERRRSGAAARARSHSDAKPTSTDSRSLARAPSRKSWVSTSTSDVSVTPQSPGRRKSFANAFLAPLRNTFRSSSSARPTSELAPCSSEFVQSPSSPDRASPSGLTDHLSPSTPNLSPSTSTPPLPPPRRRWTASGQRTPATDLSLARTRHLSNPLPPPTRPIPPIPHVHFVPRPSVTPPVPMQIAISTDDYGPSTPIDDSSSSFVLLEAAAAAASKARPKVRPLQLAPSVTVSFPELPSCSPGSGSGSGSGYPAPAPPSRARPTLYTLSHSGARSTSAIPSGTESGDRAERGRADAGGSEGDVIDPSLLAEDDGRCSVRADHTAAPTVSSLSSILPWLQELDLDSIMPALSNAE